MSDYEGNLSLGELVVSDPCGNWEEEGEDNFDVDLDNIPDSSQEVAVELLAGDQGEVQGEVQGQDLGEEVKVNVLAELNGEEVTDAEHDNFLEETFMLSDENGVNDDNMFEIMDVGCDRPHKSEDLTDEAMSFIANPKNEKALKRTVAIKISMLSAVKKMRFVKHLMKLH